MKRGRPNSTTPAQEPQDLNRKVLAVVLSKGSNGITRPQIRLETKLPDTILKKTIDTLLKTQIKEVTDIRNKRIKLLMGVGFEPVKEITGGEWYTDGKLDAEFISTLRTLCLKNIQRVEIATIEDISESIGRLGAFKDSIGEQQIHQILEALELDGEVEKVTSNGDRGFSSVPFGKICYRSRGRKLPKANAMVSIPCGVCPQISHCTPDGVISPKTCVYFKKWLDF